MPQKFIGTKVVLAKPMTLGEYNKYRGWPMPDDEDPSKNGYLVEYTDGGQSNHPGHVGYISWTPADTFDKAYRLMGNGLTFGMALEALFMGSTVARRGWRGWNGKGMYLYLVGPGRYPPSTVAGKAIADQFDDGLVPYEPYIAMKTALNTVVPWLASQTDMLAHDWEVITQ